MEGFRQEMKCQEKRLYITEREAIFARIRNRHRFKKDQRVYKCDVCRGFHLTSRLLAFQEREAKFYGWL